MTRLKGYVLVGESATIAASLGNNPDSSGFLNPLFWGEGEAVQSGLSFNPVEFDGFKF